MIMKSNKGFTLIELAIALSIIGLIAGAVYFSGSELDKSSKVGKTTSIINDLTEAIQQFKSQYKSLPGDMLVNAEITDVNALCRTGGANQGNDDNIITTTESLCVVEHLFRAGLIRSDGENMSGLKVINSPFGGNLSVLHPSTSHASGIWTKRNVSVVIELTNLSCDVVQDIDRRLDDDKINDGHALAIATDGSILPSCGPGDIIPFMVLAR